MNMKNLLFFTFAMMFSLTSVAQDDDLYFVPNNKAKSKVNASEKLINNRKFSLNTNSENTEIKVYSQNNRSEDEYNRRYTYGDSYINTDEIVEENDVAENQSAYSDIDINDDEYDFRYSRRILRFHSPRVGIALSSPFYWDIVYSYGAYDYLYDSYYIYDPFYWHYGWGYGWSWGPWSCWYGPIWGWHSPHHWHYWGCGPIWHGGGHHHYPTVNLNRYNRGTFNNRFGGGERIRTSALANSGGRSYNLRGSNQQRTSSLSRGGRTFTIADANSQNNKTSSRTSSRTSTTRNTGSYTNYTQSRSRGTTSSYVRKSDDKTQSPTYNRRSSSRSTNYNNTQSNNKTTTDRQQTQQRTVTNQNRNTNSSYNTSRSTGSSIGTSRSTGSRSMGSTSRSVGGSSRSSGGRR